MPRRRRALSVTGLAVCAASAALTLTATVAQTPLSDTGAGVLQPSLQDNSTNPPRLRRPGNEVAPGDQAPVPGRSTTPSRIGATPVYGSPQGFGAGDTGFDSTNAKGRRKLPPAPASAVPGAPQPETTFLSVPTPATPPKRPPPPPPLPAEIYPKKAAGRHGASLQPPPETAPVSNPPAEVHPSTAASRTGATVPIPPAANFEPSVIMPPDLSAAPMSVPVLRGSLITPPPTALPPNTLPFGMLPQRPLPLAEGDPYAALGIRAGSFFLLPSLDVVGAYTTNPLHTAGSAGSAPYFIVMPELQVVSDWERHSLTADIIGSYTEYGEQLVPSLDVPFFSSKIDGRIDATRDTQIVVENRFLLSTDNPGSPNLQAALAKLPINTDLGGTVGLVQEFDRLSFAVLGSFDRAVYQESQLTDGEETSNADRNFNQYAGVLRLSYDLDPGLKPFIQVQQDARIHDLQFDRNDLQRNSNGTAVLVGGDVDLFGTLTGEMAGGWTVRTYADPTLPDISGFIANGQLIWQATPLTTAKLGLTSAVSETVVDGASGDFSHDLNLEVDHAFLPWFIGTLNAGFGTDNYVGSGLRDSRYFLSGGLTYHFTRELALRGQIRQDWQIASQSGFSYTATTYLLGVHLQR